MGCTGSATSTPEKTHAMRKQSAFSTSTTGSSKISHDEYESDKCCITCPSSFKYLEKAAELRESLVFTGEIIARDREGIVQKAYNKVNNKVFAIKTITDVTEPLLAQIKVLNKCSHPHIIAFYEDFTEGNKTHIVLEYADHGDLLGMLNKTGALSEYSSAYIIKQVLEAVAYLHSALRIIHGYILVKHEYSDIKLENVVITKERTMKLIDFGSAAELDDMDIHVHAGKPKGTVPYMAPECWTGIYSPKSDVWAVGVLLSFLLFFGSPFGQYKADVFKFSEDGDKIHNECLKRLFARRRVSEECKEYIKKLLDIRMSSRLTAEEALLDPWLVKYSSLGYIQ